MVKHLTRNIIRLDKNGIAAIHCDDQRTGVIIIEYNVKPAFALKENSGMFLLSEGFYSEDNLYAELLFHLRL